VRPQTVSAKVAIACGVAVHLKQPQCIEALALARKTANTQERYTEVDMATGWGVEFLQGADTLDFDSGNQAERFAVFGMVARLVPSENGYLVLRDRDGARWVRSGWFLEYVRLTAPRVSHVHLPTLMHEAGWERPKRIKATSPTASERRAWNFYVVSEGWEDR